MDYVSLVKDFILLVFPYLIDYFKKRKKGKNNKKEGCLLIKGRTEIPNQIRKNQ